MRPLSRKLLARTTSFSISLPSPLRDLRLFLDRLLAVEQQTDQSGNGLLLAGRDEVRCVGAALNTSYHAIEAASAAGVDLLLVHHAPWEEIDLHLRETKLTRLSELGISLYAAHEALDQTPGLSVSEVLASRLGIAVEERIAGGEGVVGTVGAKRFEDWLALVAAELQTPVRAWPNRTTFCRVAVVAGAGGATGFMAEALALGCDTFLTGEGSLYTELFAREAGLTLVYATHVATEYPGICALAACVATEFGLPWVGLREAADITGGGTAPLERAP